MGTLAFQPTGTYQTKRTSVTSSPSNTKLQSPSVEKLESEKVEVMTEEDAFGEKEAANGVVSFFKNAWNSMKETGANIAQKVTSAIDGIKEKASAAKKWASEKIQSAIKAGEETLSKTGAFLTEVGTTVIGGASKLIDWTGATLIHTGASIVNGAVSLVKGLVGLVEALGDTIFLLSTVIATVPTGIVDLVSGITTGNWNFDETQSLWKESKGVIAYQWNNKLFESFYNTSVGKALDQYAYGIFKSDGIGCEVISGIGYVAGIVALTVATCGVGGAAAGGGAAATSAATATISAGSLAATAAVVGVGKYTDEEWNKNSFTISTQGEETNIQISYQKYQELEKLQVGDKTTIDFPLPLENGKEETIPLEVTALGKGEYQVSYGDQTFTFEGLKESSTAKGLLVGTVKGGWEGLQWYVGGKIGAGEFSKITNRFQSQIAQQLARSAIRVTLDTGTGVVEVPFQTAMSMIAEGKDWSQAWEDAGGWQAVATQAFIASISSVVGESIEVTTRNRAIQQTLASLGDSSSQADDIIAKQLEKLSDTDIRQMLSGMDDASKIKILGNLDSERLTSFADIAPNGWLESLQPNIDIAPIEGDFLEDVPAAAINPVIKKGLKDEKANLDIVCDILDDWGRQHGVENYSEQALRKFVNTGSAYQNVGGTLRPYITSTGNARAYLESIDPQIVDAYLHYKTLSSGSVDQLGRFFRDVASTYGDTYGVDQGGISSLCEFSYDGYNYSYSQAKQMVNDAKNSGAPIPRFKKKAKQEYFDLKEKLMTRGFTNDQASVILSSIDDVGACSYAAKANAIFYKFADNPSLFEESFGFPMYKITRTGERVLNANELLLDMYLYANDVANGGKLFEKSFLGRSYTFYCDDTIDVFGRRMLDTQNQVYMSTSSGANNQVLGNYLKSKGLEWSSTNIITNGPNNYLLNSQFDSVVDKAYTAIQQGKAVQLNIFARGNEIHMENANPALSVTTRTWGEGGGHAIFVTGMNKNGFTVSSWGKEYYIPFADLKNGGYFNIMIDDINVSLK